MKKTKLVLATLCMLSLTAMKAQDGTSKENTADEAVKAHKFYLGLEGGFSVNTSKSSLTYTGTGAPPNVSTKGNVITTGNLTPYIGYAINKHISIGVAMDFQAERLKTPEITLQGGDKGHLVNKSYSFAIGPFFRYTFPINDKFGIWLQLNADPNFGAVKQQYNSTGNEIKTLTGNLFGFDIGIAPGFNYKVANRWIFTGSFGNLGYSFDRTSSTNTSGSVAIKTVEKQSKFGFNLTKISIGFNYLF